MSLCLNRSEYHHDRIGVPHADTGCNNRPARQRQRLPPKTAFQNMKKDDKKSA